MLKLADKEGWIALSGISPKAVWTLLTLIIPPLHVINKKIDKQYIYVISIPDIHKKVTKKDTIKK